MIWDFWGLGWLSNETQMLEGKRMCSYGEETEVSWRAEGVKQPCFFPRERRQPGKEGAMPQIPEVSPCLSVRHQLPTACPQQRCTEGIFLLSSLYCGLLCPIIIKSSPFVIGVIELLREMQGEKGNSLAFAVVK